MSRVGAAAGVEAVWRRARRAVAEGALGPLGWVAIGGLAVAHAALFFWVCDDAFISFRYAAQLLDGNGLVFNPGERVEGYTNLLWVLEVALLGALGVPMPAASVALSALATLGTFVLVAELARATPFPSKRRVAVVTALLLLAVNRNVAVWSTSGLETRQFTFLVLLAICLARRALAGRASWAGASLALGAAELTRPEGALVAGCVGAWALWQLLARGQARLRPLLQLALPCGLIVVAHYLWRYAYYGDWLPNTAYAKVVRAWPDAGILYLGAAALHSGLYLSLPLAVVGGVLRRLRRGDELLSLGLAVILPHAGYILFIGGDHFEFRVFDFYWPLIAVGVGDAVAGLWLWLWRRARRARGWQPRTQSLIIGSGALGVLLVYSTVLQVAQLVVEWPRRSKRDLAPEPPVPVSVAGFPVGQALPFFEPLVEAYQGTMEQLTSHAIAVSWVEHRGFQAALLPLYGPYGAPGRERFPEGTVMAHNWMGILPYHLREVTFIDKFGLTDRTIARHGSPGNERRHMAHDRSPPPGYLERRGVNISIEPAARRLSDALSVAPHALQLDHELWAPFRSDRPAWLAAAFAGRRWYHADFRRPGRSVLAGRSATAARTLLDCERGAAGWELGGMRCARAPAKGEGPVRGHAGKAWLTSYGAGEGDRLLARASSPVFEPGPSSFLIFKIGGGAGPQVRVVLSTPDGAELASHQGRGDQTLRAEILDLSPHAGTPLRLEVIDESSGGWGHVLLDAVALVEVEPPPARRAAAAAAAPVTPPR